MVEQLDQSGYPSDLYRSVNAYLGARTTIDSRSLKMYLSPNSKRLSYALGPDDYIVDSSPGFDVTWTDHEDRSGGDAGARAGSGPRNRSMSRFFRATFRSKHQRSVHDEYIPRLLKEAAAIRFRTRDRKIHTNRKSGGGGYGSISDDDSGGYWSSMRFFHTSTFDTLDMDPDLKEEIKSDLLEFCKSEAYYAEVGRSWKRGYLLYGPPGTGKTSLVAAIANFLDFDVYDLELAAVRRNDYLRTLLVSTSPKSVIVIEDIDCTVDLRKRGVKREMEEDCKRGGSSISLSGVLNCVDGLSSSCWGERLMIFTTNHKESLDPALLRPGRMDKHIYMGYCGFAAFKVLAKNYLKIAGDHELMEEVEEMLPSARITPAEIAEVMLGCKNDPNRGMELVVEMMGKQPRSSDRER